MKQASEVSLIKKNKIGLSTVNFFFFFGALHPQCDNCRERLNEVRQRQIARDKNER